MMIPREGVDMMDLDKLMEGGEESMADGEVEDSKEEENELDQFKIVHYKKEAVHKMLRSSVRVKDKNMMILDKATAKKVLELKKVCLSSPSSSSFTVFNSFDPLHFVNIASTSGIILGNDMNSEREVVNVMVAKENAKVILTEARKRSEEEIIKEKGKKLHIVNIEGDEADLEGEDVIEEKSSNDERGDGSTYKQSGRKKRTSRKTVRKRRVRATYKEVIT
jgi:hypothetical protein